MRLARHILGFTLAFALGTAHATVFTLDTTIGGTPIAASADFTWNGNVLDLHLSNDTSSIGNIIQELTGIHFTLSGDPTLVSVSGMAEGSANCVGVAANAPCNFDSTPVDAFGTPPNLDGHGASPNGWAFLPNYALFTVAAGAGSYKPYGIVNDSITGSGTSGGTSNTQHNPMLLGPVDFQFVFAPFDLTPNVTGIQFYWGTGGDHRAGSCTSDCFSRLLVTDPVPEPQSLALVALALIAMAAMTSRRRRTIKLA
ncbi:MAG TPA: PEP-CTERM sorting domain-containing protein [Casimicrobiaceae bacterium]|nr:PEP-CTERM sorting domain-containing protein [Casimicrobiaceae bacterium]